MLTEHGKMITEVIFNDDKTERYLLRKIWDESKPLVTLIMTNPSSANAVTIDMTVHYSICNLYKLGYGGVDILNMTSVILPKIDTKSKLTLSEANVEQILKSSEKSDKVIIAWGKIGENNKKVRALQLKALKKLEPFKDKLYLIANDDGDSGFHPLAPQIRFDWYLEKFVLPEYLKEKPEPTPAQDEQKESSDEHTDKQAKDKSVKKNTQIA